MKIALIMPDNPNWIGGARSQIYVNHLVSMGHEPTVIPISGNRFPANLEPYDLIFNHAIQADPVRLRKFAQNHSWTDVVHVNHSALGHLERRDPKFCEKVSALIHAVRDEPNIWYASIDEPMIGHASGLERSLHMPSPMPLLDAVPYRPISAVPVVAMAGRVDPIKNQLNQLVALAMMEKVQIHLCMTVPDWIKSMLRALRIEAFCPGMMDHAKWLEYLKTTPDVVLQCSYAESFNNLALEAMQMGVPVVTSPVIRFGLPQIQADPNSPSDIAQSLRIALETHRELSEESVKVSGEVARTSVETFNASMSRLCSQGKRFIPRSIPRIKIGSTGSRAIALVAGDVESEMALENTRPFIEKYAEKVNAEVVIIREQPFVDYPIGNKWLVRSVADNFDRTLFLDCDVFIKHDAPDIFAHVPEEEFAAFDEFESVNPNCARKEIDLVVRSQGDFMPINSMLNGGVLLMNRSNAWLYSPPPLPAPKLHTLDQIYLTFNLWKNGIKPFKLQSAWNWTFVRPDFWRSIQKAHFIHLAGARPIDYRCELLSRFARGDFSRLDPPTKLDCVEWWV
jgi:glycosyltransferase involved in cell wall biosynthesis